MQKGYCLTQKGEYVVQEIIVSLESTAPVAPSIKKKSAKNRTFTGKIVIDKIESSDIYGKWEKDSNFEPGKYDIWLFLEVAPYTDKKIVKDLMRSFREAAEAANRNDILQFLKWLKVKYPGAV